MRESLGSEASTAFGLMVATSVLASIGGIAGGVWVSYNYEIPTFPAATFGFLLGPAVFAGLAALFYNVPARDEQPQFGKRSK